MARLLISIFFFTISISSAVAAEEITTDEATKTQEAPETNKLTEHHLKTRLTSPLTSNNSIQMFFPSMGFSPQLAYGKNGQSEFSIIYTSRKDVTEHNEDFFYKSNIDFELTSVVAATLLKSKSFFFGLNTMAVDANYKTKYSSAFGGEISGESFKGNVGIEIITLALGYSIHNITITGTQYHISIRAGQEHSDNNSQSFGIAYQISNLELGLNHNRTQEEEDYEEIGSTSGYIRFLTNKNTQLALVIRKFYDQSSADNYSYLNDNRDQPFTKDYFEYQGSIEKEISYYDLEIGLRTRQQSYTSNFTKDSYNIRQHSLILGAYHNAMTAGNWGGYLFINKGDEDGTTKAETLTMSISLNYSMNLL